MARFRDRKEGSSSSSRGGSRGPSRGPRRESRDSGRESRGGSFKDFKERRGSDRSSKRGSQGRRDFEMTKVTCDSCHQECEVPFKPTSSKPVYCSDCFSKQNKGSSSRSSGFSEKDLDIINEKLNKIMKALKIKD